MPECPIQPTAHHLLVQLIEVEETVADGLLYRPQTNKKDEQYANPVAVVVAMGPDAYKDPARFSAPWCGIGDKIFVNSYNGVRVSVDGDSNYRIINDDGVLGKVTDHTRIGRGQ